MRAVERFGLGRKYRLAGLGRGNGRYEYSKIVLVEDREPPTTLLSQIQFSNTVRKSRRNPWKIQGNTLHFLENPRKYRRKPWSTQEVQENSLEIQEIQEKSLDSQNAHCSSSTCPGGTVSSEPDLPGLPLGTPLLLSPPLEGFCRGPARPPTSRMILPLVMSLPKPSLCAKA